MDDYLYNLPSDLEEILPIIYGEIHQKLTPDFTSEDWMTLHNRAMSGDTYSAEMLITLWKEKVNPYLNPEFQMKDKY